MHARGRARRWRGVPELVIPDQVWRALPVPLVHVTADGELLAATPAYLAWASAHPDEAARALALGSRSACEHTRCTDERRTATGGRTAVWSLEAWPDPSGCGAVVELHDVTDLALREERLESWARAERHALRDAEEAGRVRRLEVEALAESRAALRASQRRYQRLVEHLPAVVYLTVGTSGGLGGLVEYASPQIEELTGFPDWRWLGASDLWRSRLHPEDRDRVVAHADRPLEPGDHRAIEYRLVHADGHDVWVREELAAVEDGSGATVVSQGVLLDVTERVLAQQQHARAEGELQLARKLEAVGQLAAGIAHEINTPIQFIGDTAAFLQDAHEDLVGVLDHHRALACTVDEAAVRAAEERVDLDDLRTRLPRAHERIADGVGRVATIVRAMKRFSPGGPSGELAPADLDRMLADTLVVARSEYRHVAEVVTDLALDREVRCSPGDLGQVFLNLVVNAAQAIAATGRAGDGTLTVRTRREGETAVVQVVDDGVGVDAATLPRVFDPFFTTKEVGVGTGQGLAIAHRIVTEMHGGTITMSSRPGEGTCVEVRLPVGGPR
ncbi:hypothetical protein C7Y72_17085 [Paraconexibacter algicola]|uniref:histidine kinase n=1 Tax=Paraconexibacter algicola TaxID=2133960 RepID=A0A2T4UCZ9_9ACTN|nr:hypothetical protein C7Y72_17085 [Paraconexibacter algicola]